MKIALDGMGGDFAPQNPVLGALAALKRFPAIETLYLVGDETQLRNEVQKHGKIPEPIQFIHATQVVAMNDSAIDAVRRKKDSSISRAVELVAKGQADAVVSAGHTGAAVAATTIKLRTLPGVERPGIATVMPTETNLFVLIDAGANIDAKPIHLGQYAIMGSLYSKHVLGFSNPSVGLMSIGTEDIKGNELTKETFKLLNSLPINFRGNIEGHDLFENPVEVVVTDGFVGNVVLKTCESIASAMLHWLKHELMKSPIRKFGALMAQNAFKTIKKKTNYEEFGGSPLLGVNGICIIAHGSSTPRAIENAIRVATESIQHNLNPHIIQAIAQAAPLFS
ncbi:MAG: phosphate acyltransferase PlsX [Verrucomicrobiae bacterium]|nr:phosphate acyltransferase PlsX [Verrucomicrobiae bacterium]